MKLKHRHFIFALFFVIATVLTGCGEGVVLNNITKVGNPLPDPVPSTSAAQMTKYLSNNPFWKSSAQTGETREVYLLEFNTDESTVSIRSDVGDEPKVINYTFVDDIIMGSLNGLTISIDTRDLEKYPYEVLLTDEDNKFSSLAFTSSLKDDEAFDKFDNAKESCFNSPSKIYDADGDLTEDGQYYVAGYVQMSNSSAGECGLRVEDVCDSNGMHLYEAVIEKDEDGNDSMAIRTVNCICGEGKCRDDLSDAVKLFGLMTGDDKCKHFPELDICVAIQQMEYMKQNPLPGLQNIQQQDKLPELNPYPINIPIPKFMAP